MTKKVKSQGNNKLLSAEKKRFRAIEIYCWIQHKAGLTYEQVAQKAGLSPRQTFRLCEKVEDVFTGKLSIEDYRNVAFFGNILQALDNLGFFLAKRKEKPTLEFLKGVGILREYVYSESADRNISPEELRKDIRKLSELVGASAKIDSASRNRIPGSLDRDSSSSKHK